MFAATKGRGAATANLQLREHSDHIKSWSADVSAALTPEWRASRARGGFSRRARVTGGGFDGNWRTSRAPQPPAKSFLDGLSTEAIKTFKDPSPMDVEEIKIKNVNYHASYTWIESTEPTMVVPGSPRMWRERPLPYTLSRDAGATYAYSNGFRMPSAPFLPLFLAIDAMDPQQEIDWSQIDLVTDRNNLRKLLGWINPTGSVAEEFRIDLQLCGLGTVLMQRWEPLAVYNGVGYGDSFERESTYAGPGCEKGTLAGHHRIISYDFHGMRVMLRCEVDSCFAPETASQAVPTDIERSKSNAVDDLTDALSSLKVDGGAPASPSRDPSHASPDVKVIKGGVVVSQSSLIKIKTRSTRNVKTFDWTATYIQLFLGQTTNLFTGVHEAGRFYEVQRSTLESLELQAAAKKAQQALKKLRRLLDEIQYVVMHHETTGRLSLVCQGGTLKIYERKSQESFLPDDVLARFN